MFYRGYGDGPDGREMGPKRQRMIEQGPPGPFYGPHPGSAFMYNPYGFVAPPPAPAFPVVRLRGLPFDCTELDVVEFFHGLDVVDVLFVHKNNKLTGDAFCVLGYPLQVDFALHKNRQNMGRRYVEVFRSTKQEYYKAIANEVAESRVHGTVTGGAGGDGGGGGGSSGRGGGGVASGGYSPRRNVQRARSSDDGKENAEHTGILRLRGLPFSAGKEDILDFFRDFDLSEDSVHVTVNGEGRPTGEAFVEFGSAEESRAAMVKDRKTLGSRYIELFPSSIEELEDALSRGR